MTDPRSDDAPAEGWEAQAEVTELAVLTAPWGRELTLKAAHWGSGMEVLQLRIRERRRFTDLDLDAATVRDLVRVMEGWLATRPAPEAGAE